MKSPSSALRGVPMRVEGRTDMTELTVSFRNFGNAPTKAICSVSVYDNFLHPMFLDAVQKITVLLANNGPTGKICNFSKL